MNQSNQFQLFKHRFFAAYFTTQALGAFNDNLFKNAIIMLITFQAVNSSVDLFNNLAAGLLIVPFVLFSSLAGQIAEKYEKSFLIRRIKIAEIIIMVFGAIGFYLANIPMLLMVLFFMGLQSSFFGPIKYSILPQHLTSDNILAGTGLVEMGTFIAIIIGMVAGGILMSFPEIGRLLVAMAIVASAIIGYIASRRIPTTPAVSPSLKIDWNLLRESIDIFRFIKSDKTLLLIVLGNAWFWFVGAIVLPQIPNFTKDLLHGDARSATFVIAAFSIGVALGSVLCDILSGKHIEIGLVPLGALGMSIFLAELYFAAPTHLVASNMLSLSQFVMTEHGVRIVLDCLMLGIFSGFYVVPLYALLQTRSEPLHLSRVIAGNNILGSLFMIGSALVSILLLSVVKLSISQLFLFISIFNLFVCGVILWHIPAHFFRFIAWILTRIVYRVRFKGVDNLPNEGACLVICNHVSYVDAFILSAVLRRPMRFVIWYKFYELPVLNYFFRLIKAIPIASFNEDKLRLAMAMKLIDKALAAGEVVCVFPEGQLTRDGKINTFKSGVEHILSRRPVPVVPVALKGLWESVFSRNPNRFKQRLTRFRTPIAVIVGEPIEPKNASISYLSSRVKELVQTRIK